MIIFCFVGLYFIGTSINYFSINYLADLSAEYGNSVVELYKFFNKYLDCNTDVESFKQVPKNYSRYMIYLILGVILILLYSLNTNYYKEAIIGISIGLLFYIISYINQTSSIFKSMCNLDIDTKKKIFDLKLILSETKDLIVINRVNFLLHNMNKSVRDLKTFKNFQIIILIILLGIIIYNIFLIF